MGKKEIEVLTIDGEVYLKFGYDEENEELLEFDFLKEGDDE